MNQTGLELSKMATLGAFGEEGFQEGVKVWYQFVVGEVDGGFVDRGSNYTVLSGGGDSTVACRGISFIQ